MERCIRMYARQSLNDRLMDVLGISESCEDTVKPDINSKGTDHHRRTALHLAAVNNSGSMVTKLIELKANVEERDGHNETPLMLAAMNGCVLSSTRLVRAGANLFATALSPVGVRTARDMAAEGENFRLVKYLLWAERRTLMSNALDRDAPIIHNHYKSILELAGYDKADVEQHGAYDGYGGNSDHYERSDSDDSELSSEVYEEYDSFLGNFLHLAAFLNPPMYE
mmetsp:Transcript_30953/g.57763  ORF Transcript_30953/g.57763 Transcript_30953/m.57763 type:complete len:225 (+) Transcript_30953:720-1394(+)